MNKLFLFLILCFLLFVQASAQFTHTGRGMYVDKFFRISTNSAGEIVVDQVFSILSIAAKENAILQYAKDNHITYLVLYDLHRVFGNPTYEAYLCSFMEKAKTQYCIEKFGVASSCASMFDNVAFVSATPAFNSSMKFFNGKEEHKPDDQFSFLKLEYKPGDSLFYLSEVNKLTLRMTSFNDSCPYKFDVN